MENREMTTMKNNDDQHQFGSHQGYPARSAQSGLPQGFPPPFPAYPQPIVTQPQPGNPNAVWTMGAPWSMPGSMPIPPEQVPLVTSHQGIEYLSTVDQLLVHQEIELLEIMTGVETENKYQVKNNLGHLVYYAVEKSDFCSRNCCGPSRSFDMKIFDNFRNEVIHLYRPYACQSCCCPCCLQSIEVSAPPGNIVGYVQQNWSLCSSTFSVKNANSDTVLRIKGPFCTCSCGGNVDFKIMNRDGTAEVGAITKQWGGWEREVTSDADTFGITFPLDLDVSMKAVLLGGLFLIDMMFYETNQNRGRR